MTLYYLWEIAITGIFDDILVGLILVALYYLNKRDRRIVANENKK
jgi:hypothetical protein